jgi:hypothetical protein
MGRRIKKTNANPGVDRDDPATILTVSMTILLPFFLFILFE